MRVTLIRIGLLLSALWLVYFNIKGLVVKFTLHTESEMSIFSGLMTAISDLMLGIPLITILIWALYNLKRFSWLSEQVFASIIKVIIIVAIVALLVSTSIYFTQSAPYLPNVSGPQFLNFIGLMNWLPYTIAELSLLGFAYLQLSSKAKGQKMPELSS